MRIKTDDIRLGLPWALLLLLGLVPLYYFAPVRVGLLLWDLIQIAFAVVVWLGIIGQINRDTIPINFSNLESAIVLAAMLVGVLMSF